MKKVLTLVGIAIGLGIIVYCCGCARPVAAPVVQAAPAIRCSVGNQRREACYPVQVKEVQVDAATIGIAVTSSDGVETTLPCRPGDNKVSFAARRYFPDGEVIPENPLHGDSRRDTAYMVFPSGVLACSKTGS